MKYIIYAAIALVGLHLRWIVSACNGWSYSINGADIVIAISCIAMAWSFKGLLPQKKARKKRSGHQARRTDTGGR